ncbi:hypothetical protein AB0A77_06040 [Streptomyces varsoviensis]|uniref:hypothetical protein n=1 Tax=Streptomyces varsoviensis TaxID=67373 RepID=UPI0033D2E18B
MSDDDPTAPRGSDPAAAAPAGPDSGGGPLSPAASLALIESERGRLLRRRGVHPAPIFASWGIAWLIGFGLCYLAAPGGPSAPLPMWAAAAVLVALCLAAMVVPVVQGVRAGRGVRGPSRTTGAMYGACWALAFLALATVNLTLARRGLDADLTTLLWTGSSLTVTGVLYLAGGMLWQDRAQYLLGVWLLASAVAGVLAGVPGNFLVLSLAGGGGLLALALYYALRRPAGGARP